MRLFKIPVTTKTTNKSIRFPNDVIDSIKKVTAGKCCTFTDFVVAAVKFALENLKEEKEIKKNQESNQWTD